MSHGVFIFYELMLRDYHKPLKINDMEWHGYTRSKLLIIYTKILVSTTATLNVIW